MTIGERKNKRSGRAAKVRSQTSRMEMSSTSTSNHEHVERAAQAGMKVAGEATRTGTEIVRRSAEDAAQGMECSLNSTAHSLQRVADQFTQILGFAGPRAEELARKSSQNMEAVSQASSVLAKGAQDISREWFDAMRERVAKNLEAMNRLAGCRSLHDLVTVQTEIVRDALGHTVNSSRRIAEASIRATEEAARIIQSQANQNVSDIRAAS